ncbi:sucrose-phosphate synthase-like protein, partial [Trifolium pratense]
MKASALSSCARVLHAPHFSHKTQATCPLAQCFNTVEFFQHLSLPTHLQHQFKQPLHYLFHVENGSTQPLLMVLETTCLDQYVVNLVEKTCACRRWELSGIPCVHAISCLWFNNTKPEDFVAHWY